MCLVGKPGELPETSPIGGGGGMWTTGHSSGRGVSLSEERNSVGKVSWRTAEHTEDVGAFASSNSAMAGNNKQPKHAHEI